MNHFVHKNLSVLGGAGGPKPPKPPPPPYLKPPKLGDLQAISAYEYVESIDLISDGSIDGLVNPNGEYLEDIRLFEGIYVNDVAVRQPVDVSSSNIVEKFDLSFIGQAFSNKFYSNGEFLTVFSNELGDLTGSQNSISFSVIDGRTNIASSIYQSISNIKSAYASISDETDSPFFKQLRLLQAKFNYNSQAEVQNYLLPILPELTQDEYPFVALKISFNILVGSDYVYALDDLLELDSDIKNQIYLPLEASEIQRKRLMIPPGKINLTYFQSSESSDQSYINGEFYLFFYKQDNVIVQNSVDAIINNIKYLNVIKPFAKFNISNATFEIRNGDELQKPLSLFNKTCLDSSYNIQLIGPFAKGRSTLSLLTPRQTEVVSEYNPNDPTSISGIISGSLKEYITAGEFDEYKRLHSGLFGSDAKLNKLVNQILINRSKYKLLSINESIDDTSPNYETWNKSLQLDAQDGYEQLFNILTFTFQAIIGKTAWGSPWFIKFIISFDRASKTFKGVVTYENSTKIYRPSSPASTVSQGSLLSSDTVFIDSLSKINDLNFKNLDWYNPFGDTDAKLNGGITNQYVWASLLRAALEYSYRPEGSEDNRGTGDKKAGTYSYSDWNSQYVKYTSDPAVPVTHLVLNPNVDQVFVSLSVRVLRDTAHRELYLRKYRLNASGGTTSVIQKEKVDAGTPIPSIIRFQIEAGYQDTDGTETVTTSRIYQVKGLVESPVTIDVGREENANSIQQYSRFILGTESIAAPIQLPPSQVGRNRFVRVYRTTYESYSSLIRREISLDKISEIINLPFSYPYSTVCGLKLDARSLSEIPPRSYDARFKKVFVPSNYFPLKANGVDKRFIPTKDLQLPRETVYVGNWDGTFKFAWTDNPAWIIFDLLINRRYGLGNFISPEQVNFWELYKIGRYCDAVDENGVFEGVPSFNGGLEPRYSFNGVIADKTNVFDLLKSIVSSFRGNMYYSNSEINFTNDRLKPIMAFFNNANVKEGMFTYSNDRRDLQYNVAEVSYLDREDLFKEKIEYIEDPDDIKNRGILRTSASTFGITSRAHAQRIGQHIIYSTINEDQNVSFVGGLETLLCRLGI